MSAPSAPFNNPSAVVPVKWDHHGEIRRFSLPADGDVYTALWKKVRELRGGDDLQGVQLFYVDGEGDSILFSSTDELRDAFAHLAQGATFKVFTAVAAENDDNADEVIVVEEAPRKCRRMLSPNSLRSRARSSRHRSSSSSSSSSSDSSSDEAKRSKKLQKKQNKKMKKWLKKSWRQVGPAGAGPKWAKKMHGHGRFGRRSMPPPFHPPTEFFPHGPPPRPGFAPFADHFRPGPPPFPGMPDFHHPHPPPPFHPHHQLKRFGKIGAKMHRRHMHRAGFC